MTSKRKRDVDDAENVDTHKPTAEFKPKQGRKWTLSVAIPGSIIINAKSRELQALLAGQIARALAVFCVDEIVIFDDGQFAPPPSEYANSSSEDSQSHNKYTGYTNPCYFLAHILSYLECPPYLRKSLFPMHPDFQYTGMLPSLDMPHHLKREDWCQYREGVTFAYRDEELQEADQKRNGAHKTFVETGLSSDEYTVFVEQDIPVDTRVTLKFRKGSDTNKTKSTYGTYQLAAEPVAPNTPREEEGWYWGYSVRVADSLSSVLTECPFDGGYDLTFGTSERGRSVADLQSGGAAAASVPEFDHMMIVFGGLAGLEVAVKADRELRQLGVTTPETLFDQWVNLVPDQGSRTIRTEEAVWLGLMAVRGIALAKGRD